MGVTFTPDFETWSYAFAGTATFDGLIRGIVDENEKSLVWPAKTKLAEGKRSLARPEGLEPPAYRFEACRSIQLSYGRTQ
jgi:hypothetical protein